MQFGFLGIGYPPESPMLTWASIARVLVVYLILKIGRERLSFKHRTKSRHNAPGNLPLLEDVQKSPNVEKLLFLAECATSYVNLVELRIFKPTSIMKYTLHQWPRFNLLVRNFGKRMEQPQESLVTQINASKLRLMSRRIWWARRHELGTIRLRECSMSKFILIGDLRWLHLARPGEMSCWWSSGRSSIHCPRVHIICRNLLALWH